jgi:SAM-dependent methyltransferase
MCEHLNDYTTAFSKYYDIINSEKEYREETLEFDSIIRQYLPKGILGLADVGCGTGNYTYEFSRLGYEVSGYDVSKSMVDIAKAKYPNLSFECRTFETEKKKFDVIVSLFNVVNSLGKYDNLIRFLQSVSNNMSDHSIFIFDMWNGVAVFKYPPQNKTKIISKDNIRIIREVIPDEVDFINQISVMTYNMKVFENDKLIEELNPALTSYFFSYNETIRALNMADLEVIKSYPYKKVNEHITEKDWKINFVCKKSANLGKKS